MTTIAAVTRDGVTAMACDSAAIDGCGRRYKHSGKIVRLSVGRDGDALLGSAGTAALGATIRAGLNLPAGPDPDDLDDIEAWAQAVAEAITDLATEAKPSLLTDDDELDGEVLLAYAGRFWYITDHLALLAEGPIAAIGSGAMLALGALEVMPPATPVAMVERAVEIACYHDAGSYLPVVVELLEADDG